MSSARVAGAVFLLLAAAWLLAPAAARATEVSSAQLRALASAAADDPAALAQLREVDSVDGRRADIAGALRGARGAALEARLALLAAPGGAAAAGDPRADARAILAEDRFQESSVPGPFRGVLQWIGDRIPDVGVGWLDDFLPGGRSVVWIALGALFALAGALVARSLLTGRVRASAAAEQRALAARDEDPRELDRRADAAEAAGDLETALRLRFRAGLLRLDARGAIVFRPSISTHEVRHRLDSADFDALAATFDDVVYGGRSPAASDVAEARERWPGVVERV